jgi:hypothetical protein
VKPSFPEFEPTRHNDLPEITITDDDIKKRDLTGLGGKLNPRNLMTLNDDAELEPVFDAPRVEGMPINSKFLNIHSEENLFE